MNDESSFLLRRVDPATEPPFTIGRLHASPATLELSADGSVETIEMRMMQVLVALNHKRGDAVSRASGMLFYQVVNRGNGAPGT